LSEDPVLVWFGHSSYFLKAGGYTILVDPVFSNNASPVSFMVKGFRGTSLYKPEDLPAIDLMILTHDHYDHLDYASIVKLKQKTKLFCTALGVGSHLEYWGVKPGVILEFDWWESREVLPGLKLTAAPARHFSGRGLRRGKTLWLSFILETKQHRLYLGGDSGYGKHFEEIGRQFGPFELAVLEAGQYNKNWPHIHMMPEETVRASLDIGAKNLLPVHWGRFTLAMHPWDEPIRRVIARAEALNVNVTTPLIGEPIRIGRNYPATTWWESIQTKV
jgi:L-ascorbate metabolism protein UlaG (beta-lactamase superfamily)